MQSTSGYLAGTRSRGELPEVTTSGIEIESTYSTTTSLAALSRWHNEHFFEGVGYDPDVVESLALADICPTDFLSADDIQLDDSGFWTSSCELTPASTSSGIAAERWGSDDDASLCFSNTCDENHSDIFNNWVDNFAEECYACEPHEAKDVTYIQTMSSDTIPVTSSVVAQQLPPDVVTFPIHGCHSAVKARNEPSIGDTDIRSDGQNVEYVPLNDFTQHATLDGGRFDADVRTITQVDNKQDSSSTMPTISDKKPPMSYMTMIAMAILGAPQKRSLLNDIYESIISNFPYYRNSKSAWRNSVRHNLSVNECFVKSGRAPSGRGFYWAIHPACLDDFKRGDFNRRQARSRAQTNYRLLEDFRRRAQIVCSSSHAAAQQDYYVRMSSTPTRQLHSYDNQLVSRVYCIKNVRAFR